MGTRISGNKLPSAYTLREFGKEAVKEEERDSEDAIMGGSICGYRVTHRPTLALSKRKKVTFSIFEDAVFGAKPVLNLFYNRHLQTKSHF
jgi:hypothetical protein